MITRLLEGTHVPTDYAALEYQYNANRSRSGSIMLDLSGHSVQSTSSTHSNSHLSHSHSHSHSQQTQENFSQSASQALNKARGVASSFGVLMGVQSMGADKGTTGSTGGVGALDEQVHGKSTSSSKSKSTSTSKSQSPPSSPSTSPNPSPNNRVVVVDKTADSRDTQQQHTAVSEPGVGGSGNSGGNEKNNTNTNINININTETLSHSSGMSVSSGMAQLGKRFSLFGQSVRETVQTQFSNTQTGTGTGEQDHGSSADVDRDRERGQNQAQHTPGNTPVNVKLNSASKAQIRTSPLSSKPSFVIEDDGPSPPVSPAQSPKGANSSNSGGLSLSPQILTPVVRTESERAQALALHKMNGIRRGETLKISRDDLPGAVLFPATILRRIRREGEMVETMQVRKSIEWCIGFFDLL